MQITYQKNDGTIIQRYRNTPLSYKIGENTSMNWKVLNIEYEYNKLIYKNKQKCIKKMQRKELYISHLRNLMYYCAAVVLVNLLKYILGI